MITNKSPCTISVYVMHTNYNNIKAMILMLWKRPVSSLLRHHPGSDPLIPLQMSPSKTSNMLESYSNQFLNLEWVLKNRNRVGEMLSARFPDRIWISSIPQMLCFYQGVHGLLMLQTNLNGDRMISPWTISPWTIFPWCFPPRLISPEENNPQSISSWCFALLVQ